MSQVKKTCQTGGTAHLADFLPRSPTRWRLPAPRGLVDPTDVSGGEGSREATPRTNQPSRYSFSAFSIVVQLLSEQAVRLKNGDTLISDQFNHQVIEVTQAGNILWSYGQIGVSGSAGGC